MLNMCSYTCVSCACVCVCVSCACVCVCVMCMCVCMSVYVQEAPNVSLREMVVCVCVWFYLGTRW